MATPSDRRFIYGSQSTPLAIVHDFVRECDRAIARSEKDQALFYWYPDKDDIDNSSTTGWHLGSEGITFFDVRSEEHTSELQSLMRTSYAVFCLKKTT